MALSVLASCEDQPASSGQLGEGGAAEFGRSADSSGGTANGGTGSGGDSGSGEAASGGSGNTGGQAGGDNQGVAGSSAIETGSAGAPGNGSFDCGSPEEPGVPELELTNLAYGFADPIYVAFAPGDDSRMFVVEKSGIIRIVVNGEALDEPFIDIRALVAENFNEMGLLGFAFHPDYGEQGKIYVYYSTEPEQESFPAHTSIVAEYTVSADNPNQVDAGSGREVLRVAQPEANHNGGNLQFGRGGYLYIAMGDGGGGGDNHGQEGNGQDLTSLLGKILRIDVNGRDGELEYAIPEGNLQAVGARPEIWSYGWRNPWRFSFDACTGDMYVGDVGEETLEEIDFESSGTAAGRNYGWRLMEAENCFLPDSGCDAGTQDLQLPVASFGRSVGQSITGGYVYRGSKIPSLRGTYLYADFAQSVFFALRMNDGSLIGEPQDITANINRGGENSIASFAQDNAGNLYVISLGGSISRVDALSTEN